MKKYKLILIFLLIFLFALAFRFDVYLNNFYPKGFDTYELANLADSIITEKYVVWNINFFSIIGKIVPSYPVGGLIFLSEISLMTNLSILNSIILWNFFFILIELLLFYNISKKFFNNNIINLTLAIIYLNTRFLIEYSKYFTARNILHVIFLSIILILLSKESLKKYFLISILLVTSFIIHRSSILIILFILSYILYKFIYKEHNFKRNIFIAIITLIILFASIYFFGHPDIGTETTRMDFNIKNTFLKDLVGIFFAISMHYGILLALIPIGYYFLLKDKDEESFLLLLMILLCIGFIVETIYFFYIFMPIITLIIGYFLKNIINKKSINILIIILILISLIIPEYVTIKKSNMEYDHIKEQTVRTGHFLKDNVNKKIICNMNTQYCSQISSIYDIDSWTVTTILKKLNTINIEYTANIKLTNIRGSIMTKDKILKTYLFSDTYTSAIIQWNTPKPILNKLLEFTNVGYLIDSINENSIRNSKKIIEKFGKYNNKIYDNGLQQVKVIKND